MEENPFDQFDEPAGTTAEANPFDQFDVPTAAPEPPRYANLGTPKKVTPQRGFQHVAPIDVPDAIPVYADDEFPITLDRSVTERTVQPATNDELAAELASGLVVDRSIETPKYPPLRPAPPIPGIEAGADPRNWGKMGLMEQAGAAGKNFVKGAAGVGTSSLRGVSTLHGASAAKDREFLDRIAAGDPAITWKEVEISGGPGLQITVDNGDGIPGVAYVQPGDAQYDFIKGNQQQQSLAREGLVQQSDPRNLPAYQAADAVDATLRDKLYTNPQQDAGWVSGKLPQAAGSMAAFAGAGALMGPGATAALGSASNAGSQLVDALNAGADLETAFKAANQGAAIGTLEALPIEVMLSRLDKITGGALKQGLIKALQTGSTEALQEFATQVLNNASAANLYDPGRDVFMGAGGAAEIGGASGALLGFLTGLVGGRRGGSATVQPRAQAPGAQPPQLPGEAGQQLPGQTAITGGNPFDQFDGQPAPGSVPEGAVDAGTVLPQIQPEPAAAQPPPAAAPVPPAPTQAPAQPPAPTVTRAEIQNLLDDPRSAAEIATADRAAAQQSELQQTPQEPVAAPIAAPVAETDQISAPVAPEAAQPVPAAEPVPAAQPRNAAPKVTQEGGGFKVEMPDGFVYRGEAGTPFKSMKQAQAFADKEMAKGTKAAPVRVERPSQADIAGQKADPDPTPAQKEAGNYQMGHMTWQGLDISIETPKGGTRKAADGSWKTENLPAHYGYLLGTTGADGDHVDVYFGDNPQAPTVFIVDQIEPGTGKFDETKTMLGFDGKDAAIAAYRGGFSDNSGASRIGAVTEMSVAQFRNWARSKKARRAVSYRGTVSSDVTKGGGDGRQTSRLQPDGRVSNLEGGQKPLQQPKDQSVQKLRRERDQNGPGMGAQLSGIPGARGQEANAAAYDRAQGQQSGLPAGQRGLGDATRAKPQSTAQTTPRNGERENSTAVEVGGRNRAGKLNNSTPTSSRMERTEIGDNTADVKPSAASPSAAGKGTADALQGSIAPSPAAAPAGPKRDVSTAAGYGSAKQQKNILQRARKRLGAKFQRSTIVQVDGTYRIIMKNATPQEADKIQAEIDRQTDIILKTTENARKRGAPKSAKPESLVEWVARMGGIQDPGGDLKSQDLDRWHIGKPGMRKLIVSPEDAKQSGMFSGNSAGWNTQTDMVEKMARDEKFLKPGESIIQALIDNRDRPRLTEVIDTSEADTATDREQGIAAAQEAGSELMGRPIDDAKAAEIFDRFMAGRSDSIQDAALDVLEDDMVRLVDETSKAAEEPFDDVADIPFDMPTKESNRGQEPGQVYPPSREAGKEPEGASSQAPEAARGGEGAAADQGSQGLDQKIWHHGTGEIFSKFSSGVTFLTDLRGNAGGYAAGKPNGRIIDVQASPKNPLYLSKATGDIGDRLLALGQENRLEKEPPISAVGPDLFWGLRSKPKMVSAIRDMGYDAIVIDSMVGEQWLIALDPDILNIVDPDQPAKANDGSSRLDAADKRLKELFPAEQKARDDFRAGKITPAEFEEGIRPYREAMAEYDAAFAEEQAKPEKKPTKAPRKQKGPSFIDRLRNYFRPGRIVPAYGGSYDKVISFVADEKGWSVTVQASDKDGNPVADKRVRTHQTVPDERDMLAWEKTNPVPEKTDQGMQSVMPGMEQTADQKKAANRSKNRDVKDGLFGERETPSEDGEQISLQESNVVKFPARIIEKAYPDGWDVSSISADDIGDQDGVIITRKVGDDIQYATTGGEYGSSEDPYPIGIVRKVDGGYKGVAVTDSFSDKDIPTYIEETRAQPTVEEAENELVVGAFESNASSKDADAYLRDVANQGEIARSVDDVPPLSFYQENGISAETRKYHKAMFDRAKPGVLNLPLPGNRVMQITKRGVSLQKNSGILQTATAAFKKWFGDSKVVDKDGNPLVVYHNGSFDENTDIPGGPMHFGTEEAAQQRAYGKQVDDAAMAVSAYQSDDGKWHWDDAGITSEEEGLPGYSSEDSAILYGRSNAVRRMGDGDADSDAGITTAAYLTIKNPKYMADLGGANGEWDAAIKQAKAEGHDGIIYRNQYEDKGSRSYIAFEPTQIKSATGNSGNFDGSDPDIRAQEPKKGSLGAMGITRKAETATEATPAQANLAGEHAVYSVNEQITAGNLKSEKAWKRRGEAYETAIKLIEQMTGVTDLRLVIADALSYEGRDIGGFFQALDKTLGVAITSTNYDPAWTLGHEVLHMLRQTGLIDNVTWDKLVAAAEREGWLERYQIERRYPNLSDAKKMEEAIAEAYGEYVAGRLKGVPQDARSAFTKIKEFFRRLRQALRAKFGWETADDIFGQAFSGYFAQPTGIGEVSRQDLYAGTSLMALGATPPVPRTKPPFSVSQLVKDFKSRPVDEAFRLPFRMLGHLPGKVGKAFEIDQNRVWVPSKKVFALWKKVVEDSKFDDTGKFKWMNPILDGARIQLGIDLGLSEAYQQQRQKRKLDARAIMFRGEKALERIQNAKLTPDQQKALYEAMTGEPVKDVSILGLAEDLATDIAEMGEEAVSLGLISQEALDRNKFAYMHRVYLQHETRDGVVAKFASSVLRRRRVRFLGDSFKGRGMYQKVTYAQIAKDAGNPNVLISEGSTISVFDILSPDGTRTIKRVYLPKSQASQASKEWQFMGDFEVRSKVKGEFVIWRDFTKNERESMGEIMDARYQLARTYQILANDLATGRFFADIAQNRDWATDVEPPREKWVEASSWNRFGFNSTSIEWVKVPTDKLPKSDTKRWGALAGKYVRAEIWRDLNETEIAQSPQLWRKLMNQWKLNKTSRSVGVHVRNVMSNMMFMDLADVTFADLYDGIKSFINKDQYYQDAVEHGAFGADMISEEIRTKHLDPILKQLLREAKQNQSIEGAFDGMTRMLAIIYTKAKAIDNKMIEAYRLEDEVFRLAMYHKMRTQGYTAVEAAEAARDQFINYDIQAPLINYLRQNYLPFLSYTYRAIPLIAKNVTMRPWKIAKYVALFHMLDMLSYSLWDGDDEEDDALKPDYERQSATLGVIPIGDELMRLGTIDGDTYYLRVSDYMPGGNLLDQSANGLPRIFNPGFVLGVGMELYMNKSAFTGQEIYGKPGDSTLDSAGAISDHLWKWWMPSSPWIPGSHYWDKIGSGISGETDSVGEEVSPYLAAAQSVGIKITKVNKDNARKRIAKFANFDLSELQDEIYAVRRKVQRNKMSREDGLEKIKELTAQKKEIADEAKRRMSAGKGNK